MTTIEQAVQDVRFSTAADFAAVHEPSAAPILGDEDQVALSAAGTLMMFGEAGTGKTATATDAVAHMGAGVAWLGLPVARPLRCAFIENEGSRGPFRRRIANKLAAWDGPPWADHVFFLTEPWGALDLTDEAHRADLAAFLNAERIDVLVLGPLVELGGGGGAEKGGTPAEVTTWTQATFVPLRAAVDHPLAIIVVHHTNKAGDVSGAWRRWPDTLLQIVSEGEGRSAFRWEKVRHGSALHGTTMHVEWERDTVGYSLIDTPGGPRKAPADAIAIWIRSEGGRATPKEIREHFGIVEGTLRDRRAALAALGIDYRGKGTNVEYVDREIHPLIEGSYPATAPRTEMRGTDSAGSNGPTMRHPDPATRNPANQATAGQGKRSEQGKSLTPHPALSIESDPPPAGSGGTHPIANDPEPELSIANLFEQLAKTDHP